jgi:hypothetical protein
MARRRADARRAAAGGSVMARIRTIKPEFWTDSKTGTMPESAKCLFIGMLNHCDDFGVLEWLPVEWRAKIFPYHSLNTDGALTDLICREFLPRGLVTVFERVTADGEVKRYVFVRNLSKHQLVNRPSKPLLEDWKKSDTPATYAERRGEEFNDVTGALMENRVSPPGVVIEHSRPERKGRDGRGEEGK